MASPLTTHILDTALGKPAANVSVRLERFVEGRAVMLADVATNDDGRVAGLIGEEDFVAGEYVLHFDTAAYFSATGRESFYPGVAVRFTVTDPTQHHHVPLLLSPFGYSTYRGS